MQTSYFPKIIYNFQVEEAAYYFTVFFPELQMLL